MEIALFYLAVFFVLTVIFLVLSVTAKDEPQRFKISDVAQFTSQCLGSLQDCMRALSRPRAFVPRDADELWREPDGDDAADCVDDDEQRSTADLQSQVAFLEDMLADLAPDHHLERVSLESRSKWLRSILTKRQPVQADRELVELPIDVTETEPRGDA